MSQRTLEQRYLISLAESFLQSSFALPEAIQFFGALRRATRWRYHFSLPAQSNLEDAFLEHVDGAISGMRLSLKQPIDADLAELSRLLGPCDELQRSSPFDETPYRFMVRGAGFDGTLILYASEVALPKISTSRVALYRSYSPQLEAPALSEEMLSQMLELIVSQRLTMAQAAVLFRVETPAQTLSPSQLNLQRVELELSPMSEVEGVWGQLEKLSMLSMEKLTKRFGAGKWNAAEGFGPTYDIELIRRGGWVGRISLQCKQTSDEQLLVDSFLLRKYAEESLGYPFWDTQASLLTLVDLFLDRDPQEEFFPEVFLGEIIEETPLSVRLAPISSGNLQEARLEKAVTAEGAAFLSGVSLRLKAPVEVDWAWLESSLGVAKKVSSWKLVSQRFYRLECQGSKSRGTLWLGVNAALAGSWIESVALRREAL